MKKILLSMVFMVLIAGACAANPPKSVDVSVVGKQVKVTVTHIVGGSKTHYIYKVEVFVNGTQMVWQNLLSQESDQVSVVYLIPSLKAQDVLEVKATCNIFGDKITKVIVGQKTGSK